MSEDAFEACSVNRTLKNILTPNIFHSSVWNSFFLRKGGKKTKSFDYCVKMVKDSEFT